MQPGPVSTGHVRQAELTYHDIVEIIPRAIGFCDERCSSQRTQHGTDAIESVQKTQYLIRPGHIANPCIPSRVRESISESCKNERDYQNRIGWMERVDDIRDQVASRSQQRDSPLAKGIVDAMVKQSGEHVSTQRRQKHQRDDGVTEVIIGFQL